jgi:hypothetical protein
MTGMKALTAMLLFLATGMACAQSAKEVAQPRPAMSSGMRMEKMPQPRPTKAGLAMTFTDDADSVMLPAFAMRTTPMPMRFVRLGIEWKF